MDHQQRYASDVELNRILHNRIADKYQGIHGDIFNSHEQARIRSILSGIRDSFTADFPVALDYGCGSGNLTHHLRALGFKVISADISDRFVELLKEKYLGDESVSPYLLSGDASADLQGYEFDVICLYSVLHHIPQYLEVLGKLMGRLKRGGYLYLDHEACDSFWEGDPAYNALQKSARLGKLRAHWRRLLSPSWYLTKYRMLRNPRYQPEGDLHVWKDDHIEWAKVRSLAVQSGLKEVKSQDYLGYQPHYGRDLFEEYVGRTSDMHYSIFQRPHSI